jgi:hypothetical protein
MLCAYESARAVARLAMVEASRVAFAVSAGPR